MEFDINVKLLQKIFKHLSIAIDHNDDILSNFKILCTEDKLLMVCTNTHVSVVCDYTDKDTVVHSYGSPVTVSYDKLKAFVTSFKVKKSETLLIKFKLDGVKLLLTSLSSEQKHNNFISVPVSERQLPSVTIPTELLFSMDSGILKRAIDKVAYAIGRNVDNTVQALGGMSVRFEPGKVAFAASNGITLSEFCAVIDTDINKEFILNYEFVSALRRVLHEDGNASLFMSNNSVAVSIDGVVVCGSLLAGCKFPDYQNVFSSFSHYFNINKELFSELLSRFSSTVDPDDNSRITIEVSDKLMRLKDAYVSAEQPIEVDNGVSLSVDLNYSHLVASVDAIKDEYILFKFSNGNSVVILDSSMYNNQKSLISPIRKR